MKLILAPILFLLSGSNLEAMLARSNRIGSTIAKQTQLTWSMLPNQAPTFARPSFAPQIQQKARYSLARRIYLDSLRAAPTYNAQNNMSLFRYAVGLGVVVGGIAGVEEILDYYQNDLKKGNYDYLYYSEGWHLEHKAESNRWARQNMDYLLQSDQDRCRGKSYLIFALSNGILDLEDLLQQDEFKKILKVTLWPIRETALGNPHVLLALNFDEGLDLLTSLSTVSVSVARTLLQVIIDNFIDEKCLSGLDPELICLFSWHNSNLDLASSREYFEVKALNAVLAIAKNANSDELNKKLWKSKWGGRLKKSGFHKVKSSALTTA